MRKFVLLTFLCAALATTQQAYSQLSVGATPYSSLKAVFDAINAGTHTGAISITISGNTSENAPAVLNASGNGAASYTSITLTATSASTISGAVAGPLVDLNGADNVTINGGNNLIIENTSAAATASTIRFIADATSNTINQTIIKGAGAATTTGVVFFSTGTTTGNDNNTISDCSIDGTGSAATCVFSNGTTTTQAHQNSGISLVNCKIYDFFAAALSGSIGVNLSGGNTDWSINGNSIYQTVARNVTTQGSSTGMQVFPTYAADRHSITNNFVGGSAPLAVGTLIYNGSGTVVVGFTGMSIQTGGTGNLIQGNVVRNISVSYNGAAGSFTSAGMFIFIGGYNGTTTLNQNTIENFSVTNSAGNAVGVGMLLNGRSAVNAGTVSATFTASNNIINNLVFTAGGTGTSQLTGIRLEASSVNSSTTATDINNPNFVLTGNTVTNLNAAASSNNTFVRGIGNAITAGTSSTSPILPKGTIQNNTISGLTTASTLASASANAAVGIYWFGAAGSTDVINISNNTIHTISATASGDVGTTIAGVFGTNGVFAITNNKIHNLANAAAGTSTTPLATGINIRAALAASTIANNFITLGVAQNTNTSFFGILNNLSAANPLNIHYNSIFIGGSATGDKNSAGIFRGSEGFTTAVTTTTNLRNNLLVNNRSGGSGAHYAIGSYGTGNWNSDFNVLNTSNAATLAFWDNASVDLPTYKTQSTVEASSRTRAVTFVSTINGDLHLSGASVGDQNLIGTPVAGITTDIDADTRSAHSPYIGADEAAIQLPIQLISFTGVRENKTNKLQWSTSGELNNKGFFLQRSADGKNFSSVAFIASKSDRGNSNTNLNYNFNDEKPLSGINYYRLQQVDNDGRINYSSVVTLKGDNGFNISSLYPNPAKDEVRLSLTTNRSDKATITIVDLSGRTQKQIIVGLVSGDNNLTINLSGLANGVYYLRLTNELGEAKTSKFIKY